MLHTNHEIRAAHLFSFLLGLTQPVKTIHAGSCHLLMGRLVDESLPLLYEEGEEHAQLVADGKHGQHLIPKHQPLEALGGG